MMKLTPAPSATAVHHAAPPRARSRATGGQRRARRRPRASISSPRRPGRAPRGHHTSGSPRGPRGGSRAAARADGAVGSDADHRLARQLDAPRAPGRRERRPDERDVDHLRRAAARRERRVADVELEVDARIAARGSASTISPASPPVSERVRFSRSRPRSPEPAAPRAASVARSARAGRRAPPRAARRPPASARRRGGRARRAARPARPRARAPAGSRSAARCAAARRRGGSAAPRRPPTNDRSCRSSISRMIGDAYHSDAIRS